MILLKLLEPLGNDFVVYFEAAKMFLQGWNPYLGLITRAFPFNYPPVSLLFLFPLGFFDYNTANILWNILSLISVLISICLIGQIKQISKKWLFPLAIIFTVFFFPVKFNIGNAQINLFLLLFCSISLFLYHSNKKNLSAVFLAFAIGIKIAPIIFILYFIIRGDWQQIFRVFTALLILIIISLIFVPISYQIIYFRDVLPLSFSSSAKDWYYNQSLWGFLARLTPTFANYLFYPIAVVILFLTCWRGRNISWQRGLAAVSCLYLLIHPIALQHYFSFAIIPLILLWNKKDWLILIACYLLLAFDIKNFNQVPKELNIFLSHDFFAVLILWTLALWREKIKILLAFYWSITILFIYFLALLCRVRFCF